MVEVVLTSPVAWPHPYGIMRHVGDVLEVTNDERDTLESLGVIGGPVAKTPEPAQDTPVVEAEEPAQEIAEGGVKRPARSANLEAWQDYARTQGIDPKGMKKPELIAALS